MRRIAGRWESASFESGLSELSGFIWSISKVRFREFERISGTEEFSDVGGDESKIMVL